MASGSSKDLMFVLNVVTAGTFCATEPATNRSQRRTARKRGRKGRR